MVVILFIFQIDLIKLKDLHKRLLTLFEMPIAPYGVVYCNLN